MPWPPTSLPSSTPVTDATTQRTQHASDHNALAVIANGVLATAWVLVTPTGGAAPAFVSPWVNYSPGIGSGWQVLRFRKELGDICRMEGFIASGPGNGTAVFTLPLGYRPAQVVRFAQPCTAATGGGGMAYVDASPSGAVNFGYLLSSLSGTVSWASMNVSWVIDPASL